MNQKQFPLVQKLEFHDFLNDAKADFPYSDIDSGICVSQERSLKYEQNLEISLHVKDHKVHEYEGVHDLYQEVLHDSLGIPHGRVYQLHTHSGGGKCQIAELLECYLGHDVDTCSKGTKSVIEVAIEDRVIDHWGSGILSYRGC